MKHFLRFLALIFLAISTQISAQNTAGSVEVGVFSAYQFSHFSGGVFEEPNAKLYDIPFSTYGVTAGAIAEFQITSNFELLGILRYEELHASKYLEDSVLSKLQDGTEISTYIYHKYEIVAPQIAVSFLGKFTFQETKLSVLGGVSLGVLLNDSEVETFGLILDPDRPTNGFGPDSIKGLKYPGIKGEYPQVSDETRTSIILYSGEIYQRQSLQLGLTAGLQYDIPLFPINEGAHKFVTLTPSVLFNYNLTTYSDYEKLRAWNVSAGFVLKVGL
ncbi:MAG: outer membrane beta-barrel protein [Ignavibacteria bacterium]|nr:outer membrane beta-barrel protein [Ignavibacteria bacterium]